ncbi:MAG: leucine-rich repeat protein [Oscillospiraceae bacterium]|nr:leucine-rich repeat protein [Oscillospiraceae bacterium]
MKKLLKLSIVTFVISIIAVSSFHPSLLSDLTNFNTPVYADTDYPSHAQVKYNDSQGLWTLDLISFKCQNSDGSYIDPEVIIEKFEPHKSLKNKNLTIPKTVSGWAYDKYNCKHAVKNAVVCGTGNYAFKCCNFAGVTIPNTFTQLGSYTFSGCRSLKSVDFEAGSKLCKSGEYSFRGCRSLKTINLPDSLTEISQNTFEGCTAITHISVPGSVISIGSNAFKDCTSLSEVCYAWDCALSELDTSAFLNCRSYTSVTIPDSVTNISNGLGSSDYVVNINFSPDKTDMIKRRLKWDSDQKFSHLRTFNSIDIVTNGAINPDFREIFASFNFGDNILIDNAMKTEISTIAYEQTKNCKNDLEKAKVLHDWICKKIQYDNENKCVNSDFSDYSVFLNDRTVCTGYAKAYTALTQAAGLESYCEYGTSHTFNVVKIGQEYYHADLCWDDDGKDTTGTFFDYDWFLNDDVDFINENNNGHHNNKIIYPTPLYNRYNSPDKIECSTVIGDGNKDRVTDKNDMELLINIILQNVSTDDPDYNAYALDLNFDGRFNFADLVVMSQYLNAQSLNSSLTMKDYLLNK